MNEEQLKYLKKIVKGRTCCEIADMMNDKFNTLYFTSSRIKHYKRRFGLVSGLDTKFKKKQTPHNKKGTGYEFVDEKTGYTYIKTLNSGWQLKHRFIWERHNGHIPDGYSVAFADQDKTNFDIDNLILIENRDKLVAKNMRLFSNNADLTKTGLLIAKLRNKCYDKSKK